LMKFGKFEIVRKVKGVKHKMQKRNLTHEWPHT
jgi:hypothetical protein